MSSNYEFSVDWFSPHWANWKTATQKLHVAKILEIGSFEGRSATKMIEEFGQKGPIEIHCIDTWSGGVEHGKFDMNNVESRFDKNIEIARHLVPNEVHVFKCKGMSSDHLLRLLAEGHRATFDLLFIDGSHQAHDVLSDLVLCYHLCKIGGLIICDDYNWSMEGQGKQDLANMPKPAIDAFTTSFVRRVRQLGLPLYQVYLMRTG